MHLGRILGDVSQGHQAFESCNILPLAQVTRPGDPSISRIRKKTGPHNPSLQELFCRDWEASVWRVEGL